MPPSARAWTVAKLQALNFEGDAETLGEYVDALIENNRATEAADPALLRQQVTADLKDFLDEESALDFVNCLMDYLSGASDGLGASDRSRDGKDASNVEPSRPHDGRSADRRGRLSEDGPRNDIRAERKDRDRAERSDRNDRMERNDRPERSERPERNERHDRNQRMDRKEHARNEHTDSLEVVRQERNVRPERNERSDRNERDWNSRQRQPPKPSVIDRLGDRHHDRERRNPREQRDQRMRDRAFVGRPSPRRDASRQSDLRDRLGNRSSKRPRDADDDERAGKSWRGESRRGGRDDFAAPLHHRAESDERRERFDDDKRSLPPWAPPTADMMQRMPIMPPPPFPPIPGIMPPPPPPLHHMPATAARGRGGFRGREWRGGGGQHGSSGGRHRHFILLAKQVPEDKMLIGPIYAFFQRFGTVRDVHRVMPDKAFIMFERREQAQAALNCVEAVMGNRHVKLYWARDSDISDSGMTLTDDGKLQEGNNGASTAAKSRASDRGGGSSGRQGGGNADNGGNSAAAAAAAASAAAATAAAAAAAGKCDAERAAAELEEKVRAAAEEKKVQMVAAEEDLRKKKEQIAALRREQDKRKAEQQAEYQKLIGEQKELMFVISKSENAKDKERLMGQWKAVMARTEELRDEIHPRAKVVPPGAATGGAGGGGGGAGEGGGGKTIWT